MTASNEVLEERIATMQVQLEATRAELKEVETEFDEFKKSTEAKERKNLMAGITLLGSVVMALIGVIWTYRGVIFR